MTDNNLTLESTYNIKTSQTITCHFSFEVIEVDLQVSETFYGRINEIYDCVICCNPNKINYEVLDGKIFNIFVSDGNE